MLLENKLITNSRIDQVSRDPQDTSNNDILYNNIALGLSGVFTYALFKKGVLKDIAKPLFELAHKTAGEGINQAGTVMDTVKQWTKLKHLTSAQLEISNQKFSAATNSIFRDRDTSLLYDIFSDFNEGIKTGNYDFYNINKLVRGTVNDLNVLTDMIKDAELQLPNAKLDYSNTYLYNRLSNFKEFTKTAERFMPKEQALYRNKFMQEFVSTMTLTQEQMEQELLESGYRKITLGDILELNDNRVLQLKEGSSLALDHPLKNRFTSLLEEINSVFGDGYNRYNGTSILAGDWKNIIIDPGLRMDIDGNIIDYRMTKDTMTKFLRSLANDFKIPLVQFNPAKVFGLDKIGRKTPLGGFITSEQYMPSITGVGGQEKTVGKWIAEQFGDDIENRNIAIINGTAYTVREVQGQVPQLVELGKGFKLHDITYAHESYGLKPLVNAERQIAGMDLGSPEKMTWEEYRATLDFEPSKKQELMYKMGYKLDIGWQEFRPKGDDEGFTLGTFDTSSSIDELTNKAIYWITSQKPFKTNGFEFDNIEDMMNFYRNPDNGGFNYKTIFGQGFESYPDEKGRKQIPKVYMAAKEGFKLKDIINAEDITTKKQNTWAYVRQYFAGRNPYDNTMDEFFTERSGIAWTVLNQLSEGLGAASPLLGLSTDSKYSVGGLFKNLILKRALPVYALLQIPGMINYFSEPFFGGEDENGNRDNITKFLMRKVVRPIDVTAHHAMDLVGATNVFKKLEELVPGYDQFNELPGIYQLGLSQTGEEREDYIENGYDPVRKGRYWGSGNTPFTGGKIMYFRPNIYRRIEADVEFSNSKWGSRQEYYSNTWFPNPVNPFAPINYFLLDRNHYDKKHYYDRPYLQSAPVGSNIPIIGPLFGSTIGSILPKTKMHKEYWRNGFQPLPGNEEPSSLITEGRSYTRNIFNNDIHVYQQAEYHAAQAAILDKQIAASSAYKAKTLISKGFRELSGITFETKSILPYRDYDRYPGNPFEVYSTPSGALSVVDVPDNLNLYNVNQDLQQYSINKVFGTNQRIDLIDAFQGPGIPVGNDSPLIDNAFVVGLGEQYNVLADVAGLKGFGLQAFITGEANTDARVIEDSGYAYSFNDSFWEANLGGLGANLSEITRRFIPQRDKNVEYVNPIRNTMPTWMPGSNYFTDFKHGDPYSKIDNGEERLPGEGYERLHNIKGLMDLRIGSSSIGYSKEDIVKHFVKDTEYMSSFTEETLNKGTKIHKLIERNWKEAGFALHTEGEIKDNRNGIIGYYDAMIVDPSSPSGVGIADIKTTSAKNLEKIRRSGKPLDHHRRQVNYYLWGTGLKKSKGYVYYVDKENLNNSYMVGFDYSQELLNDTLKNVYDARDIVRKAVKKGVIGRGQLYDTLDKFRILADVAPYSQEYKDVSMQLAGEKHSPEEQKEISAIRDRVAAQKEPLRVYPYKFKTSNLKTELVTVSRIIDNNTIVTKEYGRKHAINFAGITVSESNSQLYKSKEKEYTDKAGRKRKKRVGPTMNEAARAQINSLMMPGTKILISYDADERNKYKDNSTKSINAVVRAHGINVNKRLLSKGLAKEKESDDSAAAINVRYSKGEIVFGSVMETLTHAAADIPFIGNKLIQVRSPYEQYRKREVYSKDFQSWNHPIRDILIPPIEEQIANNKLGGLGGIITGAFLGSFFGANKYGTIVGAAIGGALPAIGKIPYAIGTTSERDWRPKRRREQEKLNEYVDILKYVKNMRLYEKYRIKALKEDHFNVESFINSKTAQGVKNKARERELTSYKQKVKLDFKHRGNYNFKYGRPKYAKYNMDRKETIRAINQELSEIQGQRKVTKLPKNALLAIDYKQAAEATMYAYEPGASLVNIMTALPKKERQYFQHFMDAPEEEKHKILRIAPSYLRRALQSVWGLPVDKKPSLNEYFQTHGLPDASWVGWDENTNIDDVKVKLIHKEKLDPGEFDVWQDDLEQADSVNIPVPNIDATNTPQAVYLRLNSILGKAGYEDVQITYMSSPSANNNTSFVIKRDSRDDVANQIQNLEL